MADEATPEVEVDVSAAAVNADQQETSEDRHVPYERFQQVNRKAKENADRLKAVEREREELRQAMEERENAGLPELDRMRRDLEKAQKRAEEAEQRATQQEQAVERSRRERLITAAAQAANFHDPDDAVVRLREQLEDIDSDADAERAVKRLAKAKKHLVRDESPKLPGRVLTNGQRVDPTDPNQVAQARTNEEADIVASALDEFLKSRSGGFPFQQS